MDHDRLLQGLVGWPYPVSRAALPLTMRVAGEACELRELQGIPVATVLAAYDALSVQTIYLRFMRPKLIPTAQQLSHFLEYDPARQISLLLITNDGELMAQAQSIRRRRNPESAEFSCLVADHFQHRGAGRRILLALALLARAAGIREWTAEVLAENRPMLSLLKHLGLPLTLVMGRELVFVRLELSVLDEWLPVLPGKPTPNTKGE